MSGDRPSETFALGDGRVLEIRPTEASDAPHLDALYRTLSSDDVHLRFFSAFRPKPEWCRRWATVGERGGFGVLATVRDPANTGTGDAGTGDVLAVGEAGYALRDDGDGDLAITVAPSWRGWLGPYLLDVLVAHAADAGVANLQADALIGNTPMIKLLRHRGAVAVEHPDGTVRMTIGTTGDVPSWPPGEHRRRLLVEVAGGRWSGEQPAADAGLATMLCSGPRRRTRHGCPLLAGERCPLADGADAIVVLLDPELDETDDLIEAHRRTNPATPVLVRRHAGRLPHGCHEVSSTAADTVDDITTMID